MFSEIGKSLMTREETEKERERSLVNIPMRDLRSVMSERTGITETVIGLEIEIGIGIEREIEIVAMTAIEHVIEEGIEVVTMSVTEIGIVIGIEIGRGIGIMKGDIQTLIAVALTIGTTMIVSSQNMRRIDMVIGIEIGIWIVQKLRMVVGGMISLSMGTEMLIMIPSTTTTLNITEVEGNMINQKATVTKIVMISMMTEWTMIIIMSVGILNHMIERGLVI